MNDSNFLNRQDNFEKKKEKEKEERERMRKLKEAKNQNIKKKLVIIVKHYPSK